MLLSLANLCFMVVVAFAAFSFGYWLRDLRDQMKDIRKQFDEYMTKPRVEEEPPEGIVIDPSDIVENTKREFQKRQKDLNK